MRLYPIVSIAAVALLAEVTPLAAQQPRPFDPSWPAVAMLAAGGEEPAPPPLPIFGEAIGVEVINLDVYVTDKSGRPVSGLSREDFELRVDGRPVEITNFLAVAAPPPPELRVATLEERRESLQLAALPEPQHVAILVDHLHIAPSGRQRAVAALRGFAEQQVAAGNRVMVLDHLQGTDVAQEFTTDEAALAGALTALETRNFRPPQWPEFLRDVKIVLETCVIPRNQENGGVPNLCTECRFELLGAARRYADQVEDRTRRTLRSLNDAVDLLAGLPGRKTLVLVGDGFPLQPGAEAFHYLAELCPALDSSFLRQAGKRNALSALHAVAERAAASRITLYTLEAKGAETAYGSSVELDDPRLVPSAVSDFERIANSQDTLHFLADQTGGRAILNANRPAPDLAKVSQDLQHYYSLGFTLSHPAEGRTHRLGVRLKRRNLRLRYARAFRHKPFDERLAERTLGTMLLGVEENPLAATATAGEPRAAADGKLVLPVEVRIPAERLALLPQEGAAGGVLTVVVAAPYERRASVRKRQVVVEPEAGSYRFGIEVAVEPGEAVIGLGLHAPLLGETSYLQVRAVVPPGA